MTNQMTRWNNYSASLAKPGESVILLDASGSMYATAKYGKGTKLSQANKACEDVDGTTIAFGMKSELADLLVGRTKVTADEWIEGDGATPLYEVFCRIRGRNMNVITLVGDGCATDADPQKVFEAALLLGVPVNCVYVAAKNADEWDEEGRELMIAIANGTGGYFLEVGVDQAQTFQSLYKELSSTLTETLALPSKAGR